ncbi:hypothetical protein RKD20_007877 [Streptomyces sp. SLBN-8D4]
MFTLSDAGGVLPDPGAGPAEGTPPNNQTRPRRYSDGGGIWQHMDHGSDTSACVSSEGLRLMGEASLRETANSP